MILIVLNKHLKVFFFMLIIDLIVEFNFLDLLALNRANKMLEDEKERKKCLEVVDEARERVDNMVII